METDILAAQIRGGLKESEDLLEFLAKKFEGPLSHLMAVRRRGGLFAKNHPVEEIVLRFDERHFQINRDPHGFVSTSVLKVVRGIVLKSAGVEIDEWIHELVEELTRQAERSESFRTALSRFILE